MDRPQKKTNSLPPTPPVTWQKRPTRKNENTISQLGPQADPIKKQRQTRVRSWFSGPAEKELGKLGFPWSCIQKKNNGWAKNRTNPQDPRFPAFLQQPASPHHTGNPQTVSAKNRVTAHMKNSLAKRCLLREKTWGTSCAQKPTLTRDQTKPQKAPTNREYSSEGKKRGNDTQPKPVVAAGVNWK